MELIARLPWRLQPGSTQRNWRRGSLLLFRSQLSHSKWSGVTPLRSASRDAGLRSVHDGQWRRRAHADVQEHHAISTQHEAAPEPVISGVAVFKVIRTLKFDLTVIIACGLHI